MQPGSRHRTAVLAGMKARAIAKQLPYQLPDPKAVVTAYPTVAADDSALLGLNTRHAANEEVAKACGLSFMFCVYEPPPEDRPISGLQNETYTSL